MLFTVLYTVTAGVAAASAALLALAVHECAHIRVALKRGYKSGELTLMPFGAVINLEETLLKEDTAAVVLAGPIANLLLTISLTALWWLAPQSYPLTCGLAKANLALAVVNLLPVYPLDGGKALSAFVNERATRISGTAIGSVIAAVFAACFTVGCIKKNPNFSLLLFAVFLGLYPLIGKKRTNLNFFRKKRQFCKLNEMSVTAKTTLSQLLKLAAKDNVIRFSVFGDNGKKLGTIEETELYGLADLGALATASECIDALKAKD